jgi:hypothetical protein
MTTKLVDLPTILAAQIAWANDLFSTGHHTYSDDGADYLSSAFALAAELVHVTPDEFEAMIDPSNEDKFVMNSYACDGVCPMIVDMLPAGWEDL